MRSIFHSVDQGAAKTDQSFAHCAAADPAPQRSLTTTGTREQGSALQPTWGKRGNKDREMWHIAGKLEADAGGKRRMR
jgi:hypothetical protein